MRLSVRYRLITCLSALLLLVAAIPAAGQTPTATSTALHAVTTYELNVTFDPTQSTIAGTEHIAWVNDTGATQHEVYLRIYPNASYYLGGSLTVAEVTVNGAPVETGDGGDPTVARVPLPSSVAPGQGAGIALSFRTEIPHNSIGNAGMLQLDARTGIWALADWYPIVAGYEPGTGWYLAPPNALGDPTFSAVAVYDVRLTMPARLAVAGTGSETDNPIPRDDGSVTRHFATGAPAREFGLAIGTPGTAVVRQVDGIMLHVIVLGDPFPAVSPARIEQLESVTLDAAAAAFAAYTRWFGPYNQRDLDITYLSLAGALGVSMSGVTWIGNAGIFTKGVLSDAERASLAFTVAHEVGHQWLIGIIGSNNNRYGFLSESLVQSLTPAALAGDKGAASAESYWRGIIGDGYLPALASGADGVVDRDVSAPDQAVSRTALIYGKGPIGFEAICQRMGPDAYFAGLRAYGQRSWLGISTPADLRQALDDAARVHGEAPTTVDALWNKWFEQADATAPEVNAVLSHAGGCVPAA